MTTMPRRASREASVARAFGGDVADVRDARTGRGVLEEAPSTPRSHDGGIDKAEVLAAMAKWETLAEMHQKEKGSCACLIC